jgi:hypothetical protein
MSFSFENNDEAVDLASDYCSFNSLAQQVKWYCSQTMGIHSVAKYQDFTSVDLLSVMGNELSGHSFWNVTVLH